MMNTAHGFSFFEVLVAMCLVTFTFLLTVKQQTHAHQVFFSILSKQNLLMATDDAFERL